jgi:hypothetical protein
MESILVTLQIDCSQTASTFWWTYWKTSNDSILDCRAMARSSKSSWWNSHLKIASGWSWYQNSNCMRQMSFQISSIEIWGTPYCLFKNVTVFTWFSWLQIILSALTATFVDRWFMRKTKGVCKSYAAILICCRTWWLALSCGWWWVIIFLKISQRRMWTLSRDNVITKSKHDIQNKNSCLQSYGIWAASILLTHSKMISKWTATILWQIYLFHLNKWSFLEEGRHIRNNLW